MINTEKITYKKCVFCKEGYTDTDLVITIKELKDAGILEDEVLIFSNSGYQLYLEVFREILETDEEYTQRMLKVEKLTHISRQRRFKEYLELKKEFEGTEEEINN